MSDSAPLSSQSSAMQVTISLLPVSLSLVHVPRSRLIQLAHPIVRQILLPHPAFLNLTSNEIELSIFAERDALDDFEAIARKDRQTLRSWSGSTSSRRYSSVSESDAVEVSYDKWNVLQIDSHSSGLDNAGARVHEISAPLAAAGISILYQSSYMSDFMFVKSSRLTEVMAILSSAGFSVYSSEPDSLSSHPLVSPADEGVLSFESASALTRKRSNTGGSSSTHASSFQPLSLDNVIELTTEHPSSVTPSMSHPPPTRANPLPSSCSDVQILTPDVTCIGLADDAADVWALKIVKLIAYPELIISDHHHARRTSAPIWERPGSGIFSLGSCFSSPNSHRRHSPSPHSISPTTLSIQPSEAQGSSPPSSPSSSSEEDGYFSASPHNRSTSSLVSSAMSRSLDDVSAAQRSSKRTDRRNAKYTHLHRIATVTEIARASSVSSSDAPPHSASSRRRLSESQPPMAHAVPFFSFTRTSEGSSLTAPTSFLAALFPPSERHMVIRSNELDELDGRDEGEQDDDTSETDSRGGPMKCLQIDLRQFGLDKHGLVNRYSRVLEENGINHMYSSTYKTANLLVDGQHAVKAQAVLKGC
ncbi:hypothetical protein OF83DRAFT_1093360 [Amylostereum chailletii]|nr:hypothetical protein OF83DRAFT_1093360 [Amylostereum chailletii]